MACEKDEGDIVGKWQPIEKCTGYYENGNFIKGETYPDELEVPWVFSSDGTLHVEHEILYYDYDRQSQSLTIKDKNDEVLQVLNVISLNGAEMILESIPSDKYVERYTFNKIK